MGWSIPHDLRLQLSHKDFHHQHVCCPLELGQRNFNGGRHRTPRVGYKRPLPDKIRFSNSSQNFILQRHIMSSNRVPKLQGGIP